MATRGRPVSQYTPSRPRSPSHSSSRSASSSPRGHRRSHSHHSHREHRPQHEHRRERRDSSSTTSGSHHHGLLKTSAGLLAGLGVAAVVARKVWPNGILHEDDEAESRDAHHHHHHHHGHDHSHHGHHSEHRHHSNHSHHRERRPSDTVETMIHRTHPSRRDGDVYYYEEPAPRPRRGSRDRPLEARGVVDRSPRTERPRLDDRGRVASLPYPERPYPSEVFYEPEPKRAVPAVAR